MREGIDSDWINALEQRGIRTALLAWFDFKSEPVAVSTLWTAIQPMGTGDALLDGITFEPIANGIPINIGDNQFSYTGSEELEIVLALPAIPPDEIMAATLDPTEYQGRTAIMWRALMITLPDATTPAEWAFRRVRAGTLDNLTVMEDGTQSTFKISIEAHASMISNATNGTYLDQPLFDPADTSQAYAVSIANNAQTPGAGATGPQTAFQLIASQAGKAQSAGWWG